MLVNIMSDYKKKEIVFEMPFYFTNTNLNIYIQEKKGKYHQI